MNFFLGAADQAPFERSLISVGDFVVLASRSASAVPARLNSTVVQKFGEEPLHVYLARPEDADQLRYKSIRSRAEYAPNVIRDPIVEFSRCFVSEAFIRRGRLYYVPTYFDDADHKTEKSEAFRDWADRLLRKARSELRTKVDGICYAGGDALKQRASGLELRHR